METQILSIPKHVLHYTRKQIIRWPFQSMAVAETELNAAACRFHSNRRIQSLCAVPCTNLKACSSSAKMELSINLNTVPTGSRGTPKKKKKKLPLKQEEFDKIWPPGEEQQVASNRFPNPPIEQSFLQEASIICPSMIRLVSTLSVILCHYLLNTASQVTHSGAPGSWI